MIYTTLQKQIDTNLKVVTQKLYTVLNYHKSKLKDHEIKLKYFKLYIESGV